LAQKGQQLWMQRLLAQMGRMVRRCLAVRLGRTAQQLWMQRLLAQMGRMVRLLLEARLDLMDLEALKVQMDRELLLLLLTLPLGKVEEANAFAIYS
jgi:hypothetical protein